MTDPLPIRPFRGPIRGSVRLPGSKSITNRALALAALADGTTTLHGALFSDDTVIMIAALRALGFNVADNPAARTIRVEGLGGRIPNRSAELFVGNAGTAARFLTALVALSPDGDYHMDGVPQMRKRPMRGLIDALQALGTEVESNNGHFPLRLKTRGLSGGPVTLNASESSQLLSALLLAAPLARAPLEIRLQGGTVSAPFVAMTLEMQRQFGQPIPDTLIQPWQQAGAEPPSVITQPHGTRYRAIADYAVEPDATAASYFLALPLVCGGEVHLPGFLPMGLQGDARFADVLSRVGVEIQLTPDGVTSRFDCRRKPRGGSWDFTAISDTFLTLAAVAPLLDGPVTISGIAHTRKQETDRVAAMATELKRLGQEVRETHDSLTIHPAALAQGCSIETYHDHRVAMSFGILGCRDLRGDGTSWLTILDPGCTAKTFPDFFDVLTRLRDAHD
jgi:3-phosphoshikimate 1-carboxyvinyltransferase